MKQGGARFTSSNAMGFIILRKDDSYTIISIIRTEYPIL